MGNDKARSTDIAVTRFSAKLLVRHPDICLINDEKYGVGLSNGGNGIAVISSTLFVEQQANFWKFEELQQREEFLRKDSFRILSESQKYFNYSWLFDIEQIALCFSNTLQICTYFRARTSLFGIKTWAAAKSDISQWKTEVAGMKTLNSFDQILTCSKLESVIKSALKKGTDNCVELGVFDRFLGVSGDNWVHQDMSLINRVASEFVTSYPLGVVNFDEFVVKWVNENRELFQIKELEKIAQDARLTSACQYLFQAPVLGL